MLFLIPILISVVIKFSFGCFSCSKMCLSPPSPNYYTPKYYEPKYDKYYEPKYEKYYAPKYYDKKEEKYYEAPKPYAASQTIATEPPKSDILPMLSMEASPVSGGVSIITPKTAIDYMDELAVIDNIKEKSTNSADLEKIHGNERLEEQSLEKMNRAEDMDGNLIEQLHDVFTTPLAITEAPRPIRDPIPMPTLSEYDTLMAEEETTKKEPTGYTISYKASY